jgi:hypothetical protein
VENFSLDLKIDPSEGGVYYFTHLLRVSDIELSIDVCSTSEDKEQAIPPLAVLPFATISRLSNNHSPFHSPSHSFIVEAEPPLFQSFQLFCL